MVVHAAIEEIRDLSGQNVIAVLGAKIDAQGARIDAQITKIRAEFKAHIDAQTSLIESVESRIEDLRQVIWRVIWTLIVLLAAPIFGLLYKALQS